MRDSSQTSTLPAPAQTLQSPDLSWAGRQTLTERLRGQLPGFGSVEWVSSTPSTNQDLAARLRQLKTALAPENASATNSQIPAMPWLRGTHEQTAGKGRAGRIWQSNPQETLMFSCAFAPHIALAQLPGLAPALGVAACEALRTLLEQYSPALSIPVSRLTLKWPNDLQWDGAKLAGILVETAQGTSSGFPSIVAGIGLNLQGAKRLSAQLGRKIADWSEVIAALKYPSDQLPATGNATATARSMSEAATLSSDKIVSAIALAWTKAIDQYAETGFAGFQHRFAQCDALLGSAVDLLDQGTVVQTGIASGTDQTGRLLLKTQKGLTPVITGDISVRPTAAASLPSPTDTPLTHAANRTS